MESFFIFYAPFLVVLASIVAAFWLAPMDRVVKDSRGQR
ncbi:cytochrome bd oxidase small subunit CydS [Neobacillus kokaensis]